MPPLSDAHRQFLKSSRFAVVSTIDAKGMPHQTVMWYVLDGDELLLSTPRESLKHRHLKHDPRISVCVEDNYTYVTLAGTVTLDEDAGSARADYQRLQKRYRHTLARMIASFMLRRALGWLRRLFKPPIGVHKSKNSVQDLLSRERVTLHMKIEKVYSSGLS